MSQIIARLVRNTSILPIAVAGLMLPTAGAQARGCKPVLIYQAVGATTVRAQRSAKDGWYRRARSKYGPNYAFSQNTKNFSFKCGRLAGGSIKCTAKGEPCSRVSTIGPAPRCKSASIRAGAFGTRRNNAEERAARRWERSSRDKHGQRFASLSVTKDRKTDCKSVGGLMACVIAARPCNAVREIKRK